MPTKKGAGGKNQEYDAITGRYVGFRQNTAYKEILESEKPKVKASGAVSGAYNDKNDPKGEKRDAHANIYYESVRNSDKNVIIDSIAKNTGMPRAEIEMAINHIFYEKHYLYNGNTYFEADYDMAQSIQRLREGVNIQSHDIVLIKHEALESKYMKKGLDYSTAHNLTNRKHNYQKAVKEFRGKQK